MASVSITELLRRLYTASKGTYSVSSSRSVATLGATTPPSSEAALPSARSMAGSMYSSRTVAHWSESPQPVSVSVSASASGIIRFFIEPPPNSPARI